MIIVLTFYNMSQFLLQYSLFHIGMNRLECNYYIYSYENMLRLKEIVCIKVINFHWHMIRNED